MQVKVDSPFDKFDTAFDKVGKNIGKRNFNRLI